MSHVTANSDIKYRIAEIAGVQAGVVHWRQLRDLGVATSTIGYWGRCGYLHRVQRGVYSVGHREQTPTAAMWAAVLYAGPGAMLSHCSAGYLIGIVDRVPEAIEVSTPRDVAEAPGLKIHCRRRLERSYEAGVPVTALEQTVLDIAASASERILRRALSRLDFQHRLNVVALESVCRHGARGSSELLAALATHRPESAYTNGVLEEDFLAGCVEWGIPMPRLNAWVAGVKVDAYWPEQKLVVEVDGVDNHSSLGQVRRDRRNEWRLRQHGLSVLRYAWDQVHGERPPAFRELARMFGV